MELPHELGLSFEQSSGQLPPFSSGSHKSSPHLVGLTAQSSQEPAFSSGSQTPFPHGGSAEQSSGQEPAFSFKSQTSLPHDGKLSQLPQSWGHTESFSLREQIPSPHSLLKQSSGHSSTVSEGSQISLLQIGSGRFSQTAVKSSTTTT